MMFQMGTWRLNMVGPLLLFSCVGNFLKKGTPCAGKESACGATSTVVASRAILVIFWSHFGAVSGVQGVETAMAFCSPHRSVESFCIPHDVGHICRLFVPIPVRICAVPRVRHAVCGVQDVERAWAICRPDRFIHSILFTPSCWSHPALDCSISRGFSVPSSR